MTPDSVCAIMEKVNAARSLIAARRRAGLSQRELARRTGVPQSTIGRIEVGAIDPRASTLDRLLRDCRFELEALPRLGDGIDRSQIIERLRLSPRERIEVASSAAATIARIRGRARKTRVKA